MHQGKQLPRHPSRNALCPKPAHILQAGTTHREIADEVPDEGGELENGRYEGEDGGVELWAKSSAINQLPPAF